MLSTPYTRPKEVVDASKLNDKAKVLVSPEALEKLLGTVVACGFCMAGRISDHEEEKLRILKCEDPKDLLVVLQSSGINNGFEM